MSVGQMSVGQMSVGQMSVGQMSVGQMSRSNVTWPNAIGPLNTCGNYLLNIKLNTQNKLHQVDIFIGEI